MLKRRKTIENGIIYDGNIPYSKQADSGKIPVVNSAGEWELGNAPSGGGDLFIATFTYDPDLEEDVCDKTFAEILAAYTADKQIFGRAGIDGVLSYSYEAAGDEADINKYTFRFLNINYWEQTPSLNESVYSITADGVTQDSFTKYTLTPIV